MRKLLAFCALAALAVIPACTCSRSEPGPAPAPSASLARPVMASVRPGVPQIRVPSRVQINSALLKPIERPAPTTNP